MGKSHKTGWSSGEVCRIIKISYRQLDYWARSRFIKPSVKLAKGSGSRRVYSFNDLIQLKVAKRLRDSGVGLKKIRKSLQYLRRNLPKESKPLAEMVFLTDGKTIFVLTDKKEIIINTLQHGQLTWNFNVDRIAQDLQNRIDSLQIGSAAK